MTDRGLRLSAHAASDRGRLRDANEDSYYAGHTVFAVADGMGGHVAGEVASRKALEPIADLDGRQFTSPERAQEALVAAITAANTAVVEQGDAEPRLQGMGTTLTAVMVRSGRLHLAHVGDSRAYLLRRGEPISQLTTDHTLVEQLVRDGRLSREQAAHHPQRSVITRAIGVERHVQVDSLPPIELQPGDSVLLCSDGLTGPVDDARITELLRAGDDGEEICQALVDAANAAGGPDNITVVLLRVDGTAPADPGGATAPARGARDEAGADGTSDGETTAPTVAAPPPVGGAGWALRTPPGTAGGGVAAPTAGRAGGFLTRHKARIITAAVAAVVILALLAAGGYALLSRAWFVGERDGQVAIYNGIPQSFAGVPLHWVREETDVATGDLPDFLAERVREGVPVASLAEARETVERQRERIEQDAPPRATPDATPAGDPTP